MKTLFGYIFVAYFAAILALTFYASHHDDVPDFYLPKPVAKQLAPAPDFASIENAKQRKAAFFAFFTPIIQQVNLDISNQRDVLIAIQDKYLATAELSPYATDIIDTLSEDYFVEPNDDKLAQLKKLLRRVNIVPTSLALAQAANESGWGTSRFAQHGHNYFGMWCYTKGCGFVPKARNSQAKHEVREFSSPLESVTAYIHNINTHRAYAALRNIRQRAVEQGLEINGVLLADGLLNYSERREAYVAEIKSMIRKNKLDQRKLILTTE